MSEPPESINTIVARNLAFRMQGKSQSAVASAANVSQKTISNCLNPEQRNDSNTGRAPSVTLAALERICGALGSEVWEMVAPFSEKETKLLAAYQKADDYERAIILRAAGIGASAPQVSAIDANVRHQKAAVTQARGKPETAKKSQRNTKP